MRAFVKFVVVLALLIGLAYEVGSPLLTRTAAAGAANDAASAAATSYFQTLSMDSAKAAASDAAAVRGATVTSVSLLPDGDLHVTVTKAAHSYVLHDVSALKNWYNVKASATAAPPRA